MGSLASDLGEHCRLATIDFSIASRVRSLLPSLFGIGMYFTFVSIRKFILMSFVWLMSSSALPGFSGGGGLASSGI